ncbi:HypC/HybG/HupF family hydrogenase formation chaperone [Thiobacter aerophilum]|uniref:HypC/HybG/HupF family hydrogenase formation chaperone n=1 Tax=Thiobacter aerophilum TaxID=3121275 RepID=A0ABV0EH92_9BURK
MIDGGFPLQAGSMCLGIPMQVVAIDGFTARCQAAGVEREVSLFLLQSQPVAVGDFVMVHVGYAIQKVGEAEARSAWELLDGLRAQDGDA